MKLAWDSDARRAKEDMPYVRERSADLYHSARWTRISRTYRASHPFCAECLRNGIIKQGEVTDHIIPYPLIRNFFETSNLQTLCERCNNLKGQRDKKIIAEWRRKQGRG